MTARKDVLFVTDAQCAERLGLTTDQFKIALHAAEQGGFPARDVLFGDRRYWPAVQAWLDRRYSIHEPNGAQYAPDEVEPWRRKAVSAPSSRDSGKIGGG